MCRFQKPSHVAFRSRNAAVPRPLAIQKHPLLVLVFVHLIDQFSVIGHRGQTDFSAFAIKIRFILDWVWLPRAAHIAELRAVELPLSLGDAHSIRQISHVLHEAILPS